jgi:hypothetical protein
MESPWGEATCNARARIGDGGSDEWAMPCASYLVTAAGRHIVAAFCKLILSLSRALSASMLSLPPNPAVSFRVEQRFQKFVPWGVDFGPIDSDDSNPEVWNSKGVEFCV